MIMKLFLRYVTIFLVLLVLPAAGMAAPKAQPQAPVYRFSPVPDGQHLSHDFIIKNPGDAPLKIRDVIPP